MGTSGATWVAAIVALLILAAVAFLVFRLLSGGTPTTPVTQVTVPSFVNLSLVDAQALAAQNGISVNPSSFVQASGVAANTVLEQDPAAGAKIDRGGVVTLKVAAGQETVPVPDLRNRTEQEAFNLLATAGLGLGPKTEAFDPVVAAGRVINSTPVGGSVVNKGTEIAYVLSKGPEPSPSPSPSPSPTPTPTPTPPPTLPPTPPPTPTPPPAQLTVADYRCTTLAQATGDIVGDGFIVGTVSDEPDGYVATDASIVIDQSPNPGQKRPSGTAIDLVVTDPASLATCPP
ncbi:MAG: PASTA domain-containing protein [Chloroflexi bacterium]|nr:PASTA domain-containing protein [Chloroflexota bacterium]